MNKKQKSYSYNRGITIIPAIIIGLIIGAVIVVGIVATQKKDPPAEDKFLFVVEEEVVPEKVAVACPSANVQSFVPGGAALENQLNIDFENDGQNEIAFTYFISPAPGTTMPNYGLRILTCDNNSWSIGYEITASPASSIGIGMEMILAYVGNSNGLFVQENFSGAGVAFDWHIVASIGGQLQRLGNASVRDAELSSRGYAFQGYNSAQTVNNTVVETISGYSPSAPRCCPDLPALEITYQFTGSSIVVTNVQ